MSFQYLVYDISCFAVLRYDPAKCTFNVKLLLVSQVEGRKDCLLFVNKLEIKRTCHVYSNQLTKNLTQLK